MADGTKKTPSPDSPEPEGGPSSRSDAFLRERMTRIRKKGEGPGVEDGPEPIPQEPTLDKRPSTGPRDEGVAPGTAETPAPKTPRPKTPAPLGNRREKIEQYRRRQQRDIIDPKRSPPALGPGAAPAEAPPLPPDLTSGANNWIPIGPSAVRKGQGATLPATSGRTPGIAVAPGGDRIYICAANGGVWRSEDIGKSWLSLMDAFDLDPLQPAADSLSCGAITLVPGANAAQDRLYVGSGEGAGGAYFGVGPLVSMDGGAGWNTESAAPGDPDLAGTAFYALAIDPANQDRVVAGLRDNDTTSGPTLLYRREPDGAGGFHWARKNLPGAFFDWVTSVVVARTGGTTTFYASPWFGPVYSSTDGDIWAVAGTGFPDARTVNTGRIALAVQPDNPSVVYALIHDRGDGTALGVWRLDTDHNTWRQVTGHPLDLCGTPGRAQGSYDLTIGVDPNDTDLIYLGGSTVRSAGEWSGSIYRCAVTSSGSGSALTYSMAPTYIGASTHADIHTFAFAPGDSNKLWVGCDGGVFYSTNPTGIGNIFQSRNSGLQTLTLEHIGHHPTEDAVLFSGSQDNGGQRFTGEEVWLHSLFGDSGHFVVNWDNPYTVIATYVESDVYRTTDGGTRYNYSPVFVPLQKDMMGRVIESVLFYPPLVGTPYNPGSPAEADIVAFGSERPWISTTFGGNWQSIPNNTYAGDQLGGVIRSMVFASATKLYAGTTIGSVFRFENTGTGWTRTQIDTTGGANALPIAGIITDIAVDPADASGNSIYITLGGSGDYRHVWHFDGTQWQQRSGPTAASLNSLLDVQHNAIVVDPAKPRHIYAGADIGIWRSTDAGATWSAFSDGLPDAAVIDLKLHNPRRLLRASTHGRGAFERKLDTLPKPGIELYIRDTQLDQGRFTTVNYLPDPTNQGETVRHWRGPDIKLDTPDVNGDYQFPLSGSIDMLDFVETLNDDSRNVATHATATITTRVYVQVHNRGVLRANGVQVMCLLANASAGLPPLPAGYEANVQSGTPINTTDWQTIGIVMLDDVRVGFPKIAALDLTSDMLPPPANLAGNDHHCVLALIHHVDDPYSSSTTNTDDNSRQERKAAHKNLKVVQFTGTLPAPPPVVVPFRIHSAHPKENMLSDLTINLAGYRGKARLFLPKIEADGDLKELAFGLYPEDDFDQFQKWTGEHQKQIKKNQESKHPYHKEWSYARLKDMSAALESGMMFIAGAKRSVGLRRLILTPSQHHTLFLMLDRPEGGRIGESFDLEIVQRDSEKQLITGGLDLRIELQPEPKEQGAAVA